MRDTGPGIQAKNRIKRTAYDRWIKRALDVLFSAALLVLLSPVFLITAILIAADDPGPVFFTQKRVGIHKTFFVMHKFRSMKTSTPRDVPTHLLEDPEQYVTKIGRTMRRYAIDELPQLWDILRGEMSFVGPRCALYNQDDLVEQRDLCGANDIRPGLTGWAQVNGRDALEIPEKARYDGYYAECIKKSSLSGFCMDVRCICRTFGVLISQSGKVAGLNRRFDKYSRDAARTAEETGTQAAKGEPGN